MENILKLDSSTFTSTDRQELHSAVNKGQDLDSLYSKMRQFYQDQQLSLYLFTPYLDTLITLTMDWLTVGNPAMFALVTCS